MGGEALSRAPPQVIVGGKPAMRYVTACITLFNRGERNITLRARGRRISNCVDVVNLLQRGFIEGLVVGDIKIGSEQIKLNDRPRFVSFIEITLKR